MFAIVVPAAALTVQRVRAVLPKKASDVPAARLMDLPAGAPRSVPNSSRSVPALTLKLPGLESGVVRPSWRTPAPVLVKSNPPMSNSEVPPLSRMSMRPSAPMVVAAARTTLRRK